MFFTKSKSPRKRARVSSPPPEGADQARDSVAAILRTLAKFALPTSQFPLDDFQPKIEALAKAVLIRSDVDAATAKPVSLQKTFSEIKQLVRQQRQAESKEYATHRESAHIIISDLVTSLKKSLEQRDNHDREVVLLLSHLEEVVAQGDLKSIKQVATKTAQQIRHVIAEQRDMDRAQLEQLSEQLRTMREELSEAKSQMQRDPLTALLNRGAFDDAFEKTVSISHASATELALFLLDLDHFKSVNDSYGHPAGDQVLKSVSKQLIRCFPRRDDMVVRLGGEEFGILCRNTGISEAPMLGERVRKQVSELEIDLDTRIHRQTLSVGVAVLQRRESPEQLFKRADQALYEAKRTGRNRVVVAE